MSPPDIVTLLQVLRKPTRVAVVAERFQCSSKALEGLLRQLQARGLVSLAEPGVGACQSGCQRCSLKTFCSTSTDEPKEFQPLLNPGDVWRITPLGEKAVAETEPN